MKQLWISTIFFCTGVVAAGECKVQPLPEDKGPPEARQLAQKWLQANPCKAADVIAPKSIKSVWKHLWAERREGGRRMDEEIPEELPSGRLMVQQGRVTFDLRQFGTGGVARILVRHEDRVLLNLTSPSTLFFFPIEPGSEGARFNWEVLTTSGTLYKGHFMPVDESTARKLQGKLQELDAIGFDESIKLLYRAALFDQFGLYADRNQVFAEIRNRLE